MGGSVSSSMREEIVKPELRRIDTVPSEISNSHSLKDNSERYSIKISQKKTRLSSKRRKELDAYSNIFTKNFQNKSFLYNNYNYQFIDYLNKEWLSQMPSTNSTDSNETSSPRSSSFSNILRVKLDHLIHEMMAKTSIVEEVYHTIFSGYDLDLRKNGHNKAVHLNHLKRRNSSMLTDRDDIIKLLNPYISIELLQHWMLLILWSIFIDEQQQYQLNSVNLPTPPSSTTASFIQAIRSNGKVVPFEDNDSKKSSNKETTLVLPFEDLQIDNNIKIKPKEGGEKIHHEKRSSFNYILSSSSPSSSSQRLFSNDDEKDDNSLPQLQPNDLKEKQKLLKYSDIIGINACIDKNEEGFMNYVLSGDWCNPSTFLTSLEIVNVAISILSVDSAIVSSSSSPSTKFPIIYVNSAWESMTGYDREDVLGKDITLLMGADTEESQSSRLGSCIKSGRRLKIGMNLLKSDQTTYIYSFLTMIPVYDHNNNYKYIVIKLYDINLLTTNLIDLKHSDEVITMISLALRNF
eukprot:gene13462-14807_t